MTVEQFTLEVLPGSPLEQALFCVVLVIAVVSLTALGKWWVSRKSDPDTQQDDSYT